MNWRTDIEAGFALHAWVTPTSTPLAFYCATDCRLKINTASSAAFSPSRLGTRLGITGSSSGWVFHGGHRFELPLNS